MRKAHFYIRAFVVPLALAIGIAALLRLTLFQVFSIPSSSMAPTLLEGDQILVTPYRVPFRTRPARGDIIVFRSAADGAFVVKRVIATPGDHVEYRESRVRLNGTTLAEPYATAGSNPQTFGPDIIPAASVFVLGDNRNNSIDSRSFGHVPTESIVGKVRCVLWSSGAGEKAARAHQARAERSRAARDLRLLRFVR